MDMKYLKSIKSRWSGHHDFAVWLVNEIKPKVTVDLGVYHGFSTFSFASLGIGMVYAIDNFNIKGSFREFSRHWEHLQLPNIVLVPKNIQDVQWKQQIDILHIDGDHNEARRDFDKYSKYVNGGCILIHDILNEAFEEPRKVFKEELENYHEVLFGDSLGLGVLTKNKKLQEKIIKAFGAKRKDV
jgi:predicted O-methyltransferase YrrM